MTSILIGDRGEDRKTRGKSQVKMDAETGVMSQAMPSVAQLPPEMKEGHGREFSESPGRANSVNALILDLCPLEM